MNDAEPLTIPRSEHAISRRALSPNAIRVLYRLHDHGYNAFLVGGCVRDLLLGREPKDFDVVTNATPGQIKRLFRNCRLVGRRFRLAHLHFQDEMIEVATFRSLGLSEAEGEETDGGTMPQRHQHGPRHLKSSDGMVLRDNVFGTQDEDARRRDFTINALYYNIADFSIIDHVGGMSDLQQGMIRIIGDPVERCTEDPVRMLRAIRFSAILGFTIEPSTWAAIVELPHTITRTAPARLFEELLKLLLSGEGGKTCQLLRQSGLFAIIFPGFSRWLDHETGHFPHTGLGQALDWVDARIQQGEKVSPPLLFALMFGEYLEEKARHLRNSGCPHQQSLDAAVAGLVQEISVAFQIPNRFVTQMHGILTWQRRFHKMPGRQPLIFISRPGFSDALDYLRFTCQANGKLNDILSWWERYLEKAQLEPKPDQEAKQQEETAPVRRSRRRRRRRRPRPETP